MNWKNTFATLILWVIVSLLTPCLAESNPDSTQIDTFCYSESEVRQMYKIIVRHDSLLVLTNEQKELIELLETQNKSLIAVNNELHVTRRKKFWLGFGSGALATIILNLTL